MRSRYAAAQAGFHIPAHIHFIVQPLSVWVGESGTQGVLPCQPACLVQGLGIWVRTLACLPIHRGCCSGCSGTAHELLWLLFRPSMLPLWLSEHDQIPSPADWPGMLGPIFESASGWAAQAPMSCCPPVAGQAVGVRARQNAVKGGSRLKLWWHLLVCRQRIPVSQRGSKAQGVDGVLCGLTDLEGRPGLLLAVGSIKQTANCAVR